MLTEYIAEDPAHLAEVLGIVPDATVWFDFGGERRFFVCTIFDGKTDAVLSVSSLWTDLALGCDSRCRRRVILRGRRSGGLSKVLFIGFIMVA